MNEYLSGGDKPLDNEDRRSNSIERLRRLEDSFQRLNATIQGIEVKQAVLESQVTNLLKNQDEIKGSIQKVKDGQGQALATTILTLIGVVVSVGLQLLGHAVRVP